MQINFKKLNSDAHIPTYGSPYAAGADLYCINDAVIEAGETVLMKTGLAVELPSGTVGLIYARSGLATKSGLAPANKVGVLDCDYRGEIMVALHNHSDSPVLVTAHTRIAQLVIAPYIYGEYVEVEELSDTVRGVGGFGSTGS